MTTIECITIAIISPSYLSVYPSQMRLLNYSVQLMVFASSAKGNHRVEGFRVSSDYCKSINTRRHLSTRRAAAVVGHEHMGEFTETTLVADFVTNNPSTANIFEKHKIDFCCGGGNTLKNACEALHLETSLVLEELAKVSRENDPAERDWAGEGNVDTIIAYILKKYHDPLRLDLVSIEGMLKKVARVHGERHPELKLMDPIFNNLSEELKIHLEKEETILFPYMKAIYVAWRDKTAAPFHHCGSVQNPIRQMEAEHEDAGQTLVSLRTLSCDFEVPTDGCNTYRALYRGLEKVENDLHRHVHLENYVLHGLVTRMEQELEGQK
jgi:regulator of cell morphogenesis and NO signaling